MKLDTYYFVPGNPNSKLPSRQRARLFLADGTELRGLLRCEMRAEMPRRLLGVKPTEPYKIEELQIAVLVRNVKTVTEPPRKKK